MINILCYGDSNTFGCRPEQHSERLAEHERWTGRLQTLLGGGYRVLEAGLNGRTTVFEDQMVPGRNGAALLQPTLESNRPLDLVILMLGTNDAKRRFGATAYDIARGMERLVQMVQQYPCGSTAGQPPLVLLLSPVHMLDCALDAPLGESFGPEGIATIRRLAPYYAKVAERYGCVFADASLWAQAGSADGIHMDAKNHAAFAQHAANLIRSLFASAK